MKNLPFAALGAFLGVLVTGVLGCELITAVDDNKIGAPGGGTASSTTTSSQGGAGGTGGAIANGGAGGAGGMVANGGAGGKGGTGGAGAGVGGTGGAGETGGTPCTGDCKPCSTVDDCAGQDTDCQKRACTSGVCGVVFTAKGTPTTAQTAGDCKVTQCDGNGSTLIADDNGDLPDDKESCTKDLCTTGTPSNPPEPAITVCTEGAGKECDGAGKCVECIVAGDCPGTDTECSQRACTSGVCGTTFTASGTLLVSQTVGDCKKAVCDGNGGTTTQNDDSDAPSDNNACTDDVCTGGVPSHPNVTNGVTCGPNLTCLSGSCTGCGVATDCPGTDDQCKTRTCIAQVCGHTFAADGFVVTAQASGDCKKNECDGNGNTVGVNDDTDLPVDDGLQCTSEVCTAGVASHPPKTTDTPCGPSNGSFCNATGTCVACNTASECPGSDTECQTRACVANACTVTFQSVGFVTSAQTSGDCKVNQCDGAGTIIAVDANGDVPLDDGNQCTGEVCNGGVPSHPPQPADTTCNQNGGQHCSATGLCVACNTAAECPGSTTACQAPACVLNACTLSFQSAGSPAGTQTPGDCQATVCNGAGAVVSVADNTDVPADDSFQCTGETCIAGVPAHPPQPLDTPCKQNGGSHCSAVGTCVACTVATECPGTDNACETRVCTPSNTCVPLLQPTGTPLPTQVPGDCQVSECDGAGNIMSVADDTDAPPDDGEQCTSDVCLGGTPAHPSLPVGTLCNENGGSHCTASGTCSVSCTTDAECPGATTECGAPACIANVCTTSFQPVGTPVASQSPNDCHTNECDGAGNVISAVDDTDTPLDDGFECTTEVCVSGVPTHEPKSVDTACTQGGGSHCDGATTCVACTTDGECPGTITACGAPACVSNACTTSFQPSGTPASTQTAGDCQVSQCDGAGNILSVADDTDLPSDTNPCTTPTCTGGVPSTPPVALGTVCIGPSGAGKCDGGGACVACFVDADCGTSTTCESFTCTAAGSCATTPTAYGTACTENGGTACDGAGACGAAPAVVVVRLGTGSAALTSAATPVFLEERFVADGSLVPRGPDLNPLALPTAVIGANARLTLSGSATSEGALALSGDGHFVTLAGYDADPVTTTGVASTSSATVNRVAGRIDASFAIDTSTRINALISANNPRSAVTDDGSHFWVGGATSGVVAIPLGTTGGTSIIPTPVLANVRALNIFAGQLYGSASSGAFTNVFTVGTGLPTTTGATATKLPGMPTTGSGASPYGYIFFDLDPTINNSLDGVNVLNALDRLYVADDRASPNGGVQRWNYSSVSNSWVLSATLNQVSTSGGAATFTAFRGVTGFVSSGTTVTLVATSSTGTALVTFIDDGTSTPVGTTIATAATNTVFRGVALPPH